MKLRDTAEKLEGIQTVESIRHILNIDRKKAIALVFRLRKKGFVKTKAGTNKLRFYYISLQNPLGGSSYYDVINAYSPIKLNAPQVYKIYGREISIEETLVYAIKSKEFRTLFASLALFSHVKNWVLLYSLAKRNNLMKEVGAIYETAKKAIKVRKMPRRMIDNLLPPEGEEKTYIIPNLRTKDLKDIEDKWRVYLPFNLADLGDYKILRPKRNI